MGLIKPRKGGVSLPTLSNPATAENILSGYEAIDSAGNLITGTRVEKNRYSVLGQYSFVNGETITISDYAEVFFFHDTVTDITYMWSPKATVNWVKYWTDGNMHSGTHDINDGIIEINDGLAITINLNTNKIKNNGNNLQYSYLNRRV